MTGLLARLALPDWLRRGLTYAGAAAACIALLWLLKGCYDRAVIRDHEAEVKAEVAVKASEAAAEASRAVTETRGQVEAGNARARDAAARSADPLRDGLRELGK